MQPKICRIPFSSNILDRLADDILTDLPGAVTGDLTAATVFLPSSRACVTLGHRLLAMSAKNTLLLPRILTPAQWAGERAAGLGLNRKPIPADAFRHLILARSLARLPWMSDRSESAPGLAAEFIGLFDEVRLHGKEALVLDRRQWDKVLALAPPAEAEVVTADLERVDEVWNLYRREIPWDGIDRLVATAKGPQDQRESPAAGRLVMVAGFGRLDPTTADLLRLVLGTAAEGRIYLAEAAGDLARLFTATWGRESGGTDPLAPSRQIETLLAGHEPPAVDAVAEPPLRDRLAALQTGPGPSPLLAPTGPVAMVPCGDPEAESRLVAHRVVEILSRPDGGSRRIAVAVPDPQLAARITAQLRAAGIDSDNTHGRPLSSLPAGLLVRFILRAALTDLRPEPLLEVLTHPYVQLTVGEGSHEIWTLRLERMFRRNRGPQGGLAGLHRRAAERDQAALNIFRRQDPGMELFVTAVAAAFEPLLPFGSGKPRPWNELLAALEKTWAALAADQPLAENLERPDTTAVARLLADLQADADRLPPVGLADFAADLGRLLAGANVPAHRARNLPVLVTGLVEARLEAFDHLIVAGLRDGVFPARPTRPLLLGGAMRARLGLPGWQDSLGRDAELFLRLLHNAPEVLLTWSTEDEGQPTLRSGFVARLELVLRPAYGPQDPVPLWRREAVPWVEIDRQEEAFRNENPAPPAAAGSRPLTRLSWSALRTWRDCPYRYYLERGLALYKEEEVQEEFGRLEYGSLVHEVLAAWLDPDGAGYTALAQADRTAAAAALEAEAARVFAPGARELPQRRLWQDTFSRSFGPLVAQELDRFKHWRPVALEKQFAMPLTDLVGWIEGEADRQGVEPALPAMGERQGDILLRGTIDRIDRALDGDQTLAVIDYKTGKPPSARKVQELEEMQVLLYAAAVEAGALADVRGRVDEGFYYGVAEDNPGRPHKPHLDGTNATGRTLLLDGAASLVDLAYRAADPAGSFPLIPREMNGEGATRLPCDYCDFRGLCRLEERPLPAATDRKLDRLVNRKDMF